jgi:hypothetical protein
LFQQVFDYIRACHDAFQIFAIHHGQRMKIFFGENNPKISENASLGNNKITTTKYNLISF